jgi:hypothetical protein
MESNKELLGEFLDDIWGKGDKPRRVGLSYKATPQSYEIPPLQNWPKSRNIVLEFIQGINAKGQTIYFSPAMLKPDAISLEKTDVLASWVLWCDFDGNAEEALARLEALPGLPRPTWRLSSGLPGHEHWYWLLEAPEGAQSFEAYNKKLAYYLKADIGCWNMNRVMRPPYTTNYMDAEKYQKTGKKYDPQAVDFIEHTKRRYKITDFDLLPATERAIEYSVKELKDIPSIGSVLAKYVWDEKHIDVFMNPPMKKGGRSDAIARLAHFGAERSMTDEEIYAVISDVDNRVGKFTGRADRDRRLAEFIVNARVKHPFGGNVTQNFTQENIQLVWTANELLRSEFKIDWLIDQLIVARTINMITSAPGSGKSRLSMQLAKAMATGTQFLKWPIEKPMKVMYLSLEMQIDMLKHFLSQLTEDMTEEESNRFLLVPVGKAVDITKPEGMNFIKMLVSEHKPDVLFVDALGKLVLEEIGEVQAKSISNQLMALTAEFGTTFFIVHHNRKDDKTDGKTKKRPSLADVYGNQYITTDATLVLMMWVPESQAHVELIFAKSRAYPSDEYLVLNGKKGFAFTLKEKEEAYEPPDINWQYGDN